MTASAKPTNTTRPVRIQSHRHWRLFFESTDFEDAIRNAISIGGDSDTLAAITGSVAEAYYGVPTSIRKRAITFLDERLLEILLEFESRYPAKTYEGNVEYLREWLIRRNAWLLHELGIS